MATKREKPSSGSIGDGVATETVEEGQISWAEFRKGFTETLPLWLGIVPFGLAYALAARTAGLGPVEIQAMSIMVYAGASQLTAASLFAAGAGGCSIILATLLVNLRHLLFATSLTESLRQFSLLKKMALAFSLTDASYVLTIERVLSGQAGPGLLWGANMSLYVCWQVSTLAGLLVGGVIPDTIGAGLQLVFPLSFAVLLAPSLTSRSNWAAAVVAGGLALIVQLTLGGSWYLLIAALGGCLAGMLVEGRPERKAII